MCYQLSDGVQLPERQAACVFLVEFLEQNADFLFVSLLAQKKMDSLIEILKANLSIQVPVKQLPKLPLLQLIAHAVEHLEKGINLDKCVTEGGRVWAWVVVLLVDLLDCLAFVWLAEYEVHDAG